MEREEKRKGKTANKAKRGGERKQKQDERGSEVEYVEKRVNK